MFQTPILLLIFNRPGNTRQILERLKEVKPARLYVAADGPRENRPNDTALCLETRNLVDKIVTWPCEIHKIFRTENLGCGLAVSDAITWFFKQEEKGIILEDDTLPDPSFFDFCEEMLERYKDRPDVMHISGSNYASNSPEASYYFTKLPFIWGWATWRRAWDTYDFNNKYIPVDKKRSILENAFDNKDIINYWADKLKDFHLNPLSYTWDYQWFLSIWNRNGLVIQPSKNLVKNIGFDEHATHTVDADHHLAGIEAEHLSTIKHPSNGSVAIDEKRQNENFYFYYTPKGGPDTRSYLERLKLKFKFKFGQILYGILRYYNPKLDFLETASTLELGFQNSTKGENSRLYPVYQVFNSQIGDYTYIARNSVINNTTIGRFCSIGPNLICGWGIHPTDKLSTSPMFYSTKRQNGLTLSTSDKIEEMKNITIGNDVFIGMNVTILDGVKIGDGAVIGAGAVVSKDIPPYAIAVGNPVKIIKFRFNEDKINELLKIRWWDWDIKQLPEVEKYFDKVDDFINKHSNDIK